jgi:dihydropteroate synthase
MITADQLIELWSTYRDDITSKVQTLHFPRQGRTFEDAPYQLGVMNLSRDSSYRESIVHDLDAAIYRARRMTIEGAAMVDIGAESTGTNADVIDIARQVDSLLPVVRALVADKIMVSVETYHTEVAVAALDAGAAVINLTGRVDDVGLYESIAAHEAGLILCYTPGTTARSGDDVPTADRMIDEQMDFFRSVLTWLVAQVWSASGLTLASGLP